MPGEFDPVIKNIAPHMAWFDNHMPLALQMESEVLTKIGPVSLHIHRHYKCALGVARGNVSRPMENIHKLFAAWYPHFRRVKIGGESQTMCSVVSAPLLQASINDTMSGQVFSTLVYRSWEPLQRSRRSRRAHESMQLAAPDAELRRKQTFEGQFEVCIDSRTCDLHGAANRRWGDSLAPRLQT